MAIKKNTKRWLAGIFAGLFYLWLGFVGYIDWARHQPPRSLQACHGENADACLLSLSV
jgi:hypothetical protein